MNDIGCKNESSKYIYVYIVHPNVLDQWCTNWWPWNVYKVSVILLREIIRLYVAYNVYIYIVVLHVGRVVSSK